jgi:hypothetical protein
MRDVGHNPRARRRTGHVTDFGISDRYPPLAQLGPVTTDLPAPAG